MAALHRIEEQLGLTAILHGTNESKVAEVEHVN